MIVYVYVVVAYETTKGDDEGCRRLQNDLGRVLSRVGNGYRMHVVGVSEAKHGLQCLCRCRERVLKE